MKIKHCLFRAGLAAFIVVTLVGCFSPWAGGEGTLTLHLGGDSGGRAAVANGEQNSFTYEVTLSGPGSAITETFSGGTTHTFRVQPGTWNVVVKGRGKRPAEGYTAFPQTTLRAYGEKTITIKAESESKESIDMYPAAEAANYAQLKQAFDGARIDGKKEYVFVAGNIVVPNLADNPNPVIYVVTGQDIELRAEKEVTIQGSDGGAFSVTGGILTLGKANEDNLNLNIKGIQAGMGSSLIYVLQNGDAPEPGELVMNDARIHGNSAAANGGGVYVRNGSFTMNGGSIEDNTTLYDGGQVYVGHGGTFEMNDGTLSGGGLGNHARRGGGVYIEMSDPSGSFTKKGGTIYGNDDSRNGLFSTEDGAAVCFYHMNDNEYFFRNGTLWQDEPLSTDPGEENWDF